MPGRGIAERASEEVYALHAFFAAWFRGIADAPADFVVCEAALAPDFRMVDPDGGVHDRAAVLGRLRAARGSAPADFSIDILEPRAVWASADAALLEYVERQYRDGRMSSRRSTALFTADATAPRQVVWRHLQETWTGATSGYAA
jgi:hypothetical protein